MTKHTREEKLAAFGRLLDVQYRLRKDCPGTASRLLRACVPIPSKRFMNCVMPS